MRIIKISLFLAILLVNTSMLAQDRVLVVSGGGAKGAWGGGLAQTLVEDFEYNYKVVVGSSTGSLLAPLIALEEFDALREGYTTITDKDIFNVPPYKTSGRNRGQLRGFNAFFRVITGRRTLGSSKNLLKTIRQFYTPAMYEKFKTNGKEHIATVVNLTTDGTEYKSSKDYSYDEMTEWMWASANAPIFMSLYKKDTLVDGSDTRYFYVDGGVKEGVPLQKGIDFACADAAIKDIDVIVHSTLSPAYETVENGGIFKLLNRTIDLFLTENRQNDLAAAFRVEQIADDIEFADNSNVLNINYYFMSEEAMNVISNELLFDPTEMSKLWELGRKHVELEMSNEALRPLLINISVSKSNFCSFPSFLAPERDNE